MLRVLGLPPPNQEAAAGPRAVPGIGAQAEPRPQRGRVREGHHARCLEGPTGNDPPEHGPGAAAVGLLALWLSETSWREGVCASVGRGEVSGPAVGSCDPGRRRMRQMGTGAETRPGRCQTPRCSQAPALAAPRQHPLQGQALRRAGTTASLLSLLWGQQPFSGLLTTSMAR